MNKRLLTITAIFALGLSTPAALMSCGEPTAQVTKISITNGEALKEPWHVGDAAREVEVSTDAPINVLAALKEGKLTIESNNPAAVLVSSKMLYPQGAGAATITVTYNANGVVKAGEGVTEEQLATNKVDTIDLVVLEMEKEPEFVTGKKLGDLMGIAQSELVADGSNFRGKEAYITKVKVAVLGSAKDGSKDADKYGNMYVKAEDGSGDLVQVYGAGADFKALKYDKALKAYKYSNSQNYLTNADTKAIKVGDVLEVIAIRADYKTTKEISFVIRAINGKKINNGTTTVEDINKTELATREKSVLRSVTGVITKWASGKTDGTKYGNFYIATEGKKEELYVYGASVASAYPYSYTSGDTTKTVETPWGDNKDGSYKFNNPQAFLDNAESKTITIGTKVTVEGIRCDYNGTIEWTGVITSFTLAN